MTGPLHRELQLEQVRRQIRDAEPDELRGITGALLGHLMTSQQALMGASWKLGELERENGDLRRKLVELRAS